MLQIEYDLVWNLCCKKCQIKESDPERGGNWSLSTLRRSRHKYKVVMACLSGGKRHWSLCPVWKGQAQRMSMRLYSVRERDRDRKRGLTKHAVKYMPTSCWSAGLKVLGEGSGLGVPTVDSKESPPPLTASVPASSVSSTPLPFPAVPVTPASLYSATNIGAMNRRRHALLEKPRRTSRPDWVIVVVVVVVVFKKTCSALVIGWEKSDETPTAMAGLPLQTRQEEEQDHLLFQEFTGSKTAAAAGNCKHAHWHCNALMVTPPYPVLHRTEHPQLNFETSLSISVCLPLSLCLSFSPRSKKN